MQLYNLCPTPTVLELADIFKIKPEVVLDEIVFSLDSWEYGFYFFVTT